MPWKYSGTPTVIVGTWNMHLLLSWRIIEGLLKKGHFYTSSHSPKSFHMYNPTCSSQRPFEPASSLWPLWMEEGGLGKRNHLTKVMQTGGAALESQNRALASGSVMSCLCLGMLGETWKDEKEWPDVVKSLSDHLEIWPRFTAKFKKTWNNHFTFK